MKKSRLVLTLFSVLLAEAALAGGDLEDLTSRRLDAHLYAEARSELMRIGDESPDFAIAQRLLGDIHANGQGVPKDGVKAMAFWRAAAERGDESAMYSLGKAYEEGSLVEASAESAYTWYDRAATAHPLAALRYAEIALANRDRDGFVARHDPIDRLLFAVEHDVPRAQYLLGRMALDGSVDTVGQEEASSLLEAASATVGEASTALAIIAHQAGNPSGAKTHFMTALAQGDLTAAAYLGHYAEHGIDQPIDRKAAWTYYEKADDIGWAKEGLERLRRHANSIELLGIPVYGTTRREIWSRMKAMGLTLLANESHWDTFDGAPKLGGHKGVITIAYVPKSPTYVAEVSYQFHSEDKRSARSVYKEVHGSLLSKYGEIDRHTRESGVRRLYWHIGDTTIELSHDNKDTSVYVTYRLRPYSAQLRAYLAKEDPQGGIEDAL